MVFFHSLYCGNVIILSRQVMQYFFQGNSKDFLLKLFTKFRKFVAVEQVIWYFLLGNSRKIQEYTMLWLFTLLFFNYFNVYISV